MSRTLEQHIAVFGESGSGKTVMISSFYGAAQEPQNIKKSQFHVVAENPGQGTHLSQNYYGMKRSGTMPEANRFAAPSYSFLIKLKNVASAKKKGKPFDALRLVWHDYPGEWFEQDVSGPEEAQRRVGAFRALLSSDVALLLVDGQRLLDNKGQEGSYLKSLLSDYRNGLLLLKDDLLVDGKPLVQFPRIWVMGLSKSDLHPGLSAHGFSELLLENAGAEVEELRGVLAGLIESSDALSVSEDFVLLSSAKFESGKVEVGTRIGLDLILPLAAVLSIERHLRWARAGKVSRKVATELLAGVVGIAIALGGLGELATRLANRQNKLLIGIGLVLTQFGSALEAAVKQGEVALRAKHEKAILAEDGLAATLMGFQLALNSAEEEGILIRSAR